MMYSMDKSTGSPICGLVIGNEEEMVPYRRALGMHSARGGGLAYGKAAYVGYEPGAQRCCMKGPRAEPASGSHEM
jgi:hypothetical protein